MSTFTSNLGKLLENINRASYGANAAIANIIESATGEDEFNPLRSFAQGFKLEKKVIGSDIIDLLIGEQTGDSTAEKIARGILGFGIDIFADPLTYTGIGALTKTGKTAIKATGLIKEGKRIEEGTKLFKEISKLKPEQLEFGKTLVEQAEKGQRSLITFMGQSILPKTVNKAALGFIAQTSNWIKNLPLINQAIKGAKNLFVATTGNKEFDDMVRKFYSQISENADKHINYLKTLYPKMRRMGEKEWAEIQEYMYGFKKTTSTPEIQEIGDKLKDFFKDIAETEQQKGVLKTTIDNYFTGIPTNEAIPFLHRLAKHKGMGINELEQKLEFAKEKILTKELTPSQMNGVINLVIGSDVPVDKIKNEIVERLSDAAKKSLAGLQESAWQLGKESKKLKKFFHTDPLLVATKRAFSSVNAIARKELIENAKKFGVLKNEWLKKPIPDRANYRYVKNVDELSDYLFPEEIAQALERFHAPLTNIKELNNIIGTYKDLIKFWKRWTLSIFPEYHARNIIGNFWNNYIVAGINSPLPYIRTATMLQLIDKPEKLEKIILKTEAGEKITAKQLIQEAKDYNIINADIFTHEITENLLNQYKGASWNPLSERFIMIKTGRKAGQILENNARLTHYYYQRMKGYSPSYAAESTRKALFDYNELTAFEKGVMRDLLFPFYSWSRFNIPLQFQNIIMQPGKYSQIAKGKEEIEKQQGTRNIKVDWMPEWMQDNLPVILNKMDDKNRYKVFLLMNWLPSGDLNKILSKSEFSKMILTSLEPFSKEFLQQISGKDFYLEKDIENYPGEMANMLGINMSAKTRHILRMFRIINFIDQMNPGGMFGEEGGKKSIFGAERQLLDITPEEKITKTLTGLRIYPYDIEKSKTFLKAKLSSRIKKLEILMKGEIKKGHYQKAAQINDILNKLKLQLQEVKQ